MAKNEIGHEMTEEEIDAEVEKQLCGYSDELTEVDKQIVGGKFLDAITKLEELQKSSACELCQNIFGEIIETTQEAVKSCKLSTGKCDYPIEPIREKIAVAKTIFCPSSD